MSKPSEEIRKIWAEMKILKIMRERSPMELIKAGYDRRKDELENKYEELDTLFGHESTLLKAIIFYLDTKK